MMIGELGKREREHLHLILPASKWFVDDIGKTKGRTACGIHLDVRIVVDNKLQHNAYIGYALRFIHEHYLLCADNSSQTC